MATAEEWDANMSTLQDEAERNSLFRVIDSFYQYRHQTHYNTTHKRRQNFYALPRQHQELLSEPPFNMRERFNAIDAAIDDNAVISECIMSNAMETFGLDDDHAESSQPPWKGMSTLDDLIKASTIINQFYRDWSSEGSIERDAHFKPVLTQLEKLFHDRKVRNDVKVLVPGAGLGRLVFDICNVGFSAEGNEISYHALLASNWILNSLEAGKQYPLYPFATRLSNNEKLDDQLKMVLIPDVHPEMERRRLMVKSNAMSNTSAMGPKSSWKPGEMSMSASDFLTAYQQEDQSEEFDAVATVFFIDTAPNVIRYIEAIRHTLKTGGYWINLGPLLWHFENKESEKTKMDSSENQSRPGIEEPGGVELTQEDIINLVKIMGFEIEVFDLDNSRSIGYIQQRTSMMQSTYRVLHFVARKL